MRTSLLCLALQFSLLSLSHCQVSQSSVPGLTFNFTHSLYNATIYENSAAGTYINSEVRMGITLVVRSWKVIYRISSGDGGLFQAENYTLGDFCFLRIHTRSGSSAILNREVRDTYILTVTAATPDGLEALAMVAVLVLDTNDLRPLFTPTIYSVTVQEKIPLGTSVVQVTATDADAGSNAELYYFFREKVELLAIHPTSGVVFLIAQPSPDQRGLQEIEILAVDRGIKLYGDESTSSTAKLFLQLEHVNNHSPTITVVSRVPSRQDKDPVFAEVIVEDLDDGLNGDIEGVSIVAGDPQKLFVLDKLSGGNEYKVVMSEPRDWGQFTYGYNLTLQAKDRGSPPKFSDLQVVWVSIQSPQPVQRRFEKELYDVIINEISPPGFIVEVIRIFPEQSNARYMLNPTTDSTHFDINSLTGVITTACSLTTVNQELLALEVVEVESRLRTKVYITIEDANDNSPVFSQASYQGTVNEHSPVGTVILVVSAVDGDKGENASVIYSISSFQQLPFALDQYTGVLKTIKELDFESCPELYVFVVRASDCGTPYRRESEVNITISLVNINDNPPQFDKVACRGAISLDFPVGQPIITMSAIDLDKPESIIYKIQSGDEQDFFNLNLDTGVLSLKKSLVTANPKNGVFSLEVIASDGAILSDPTFVNISLLRGQMSLKNLNCEETKAAEKLVGKLLNKTRIDDRSTVIERFSDVFTMNRQSPQFESLPSEIWVREDLAVGASVFRVHAYDGDSGFSGKILFAISDGNKDSCFNIDMDNGWITVLLPMDREKTNKYVLNLTIYDMGLPQRSTARLLILNLEDTNDNAPQFEQESYNTVILENTTIGTDIIQVKATDKDQGWNGQVYYTLLTSTTAFKISSTTGIVQVSEKLDREYIPTFYLQIEARDGAETGSQRFSLTILSISLEDVNDCSPTFIPKGYSTRVPEDLPSGTVITWLEAHDPDLGPGGQVKYSLADDYDGMFVVNRDSGTVRLVGDLDYEKHNFYNLTVIADDRGFPVPLRSVSFIVVEVIDVNENLNAPHFTNFTLSTTVKENSRVGTSILRVVAWDNDQGRDGEIRFSVKAGSGLGRFTIDEESGIIYTMDILDHEIKDSYWLTVQATDRGLVPLCSTVEVYIQVEDVNDNAPLTSEPIYRPAIMENSAKGLSVLQVQAQDLDTTTSVSHLSYRIASGNPQNFFTINPKTGLITTTSRKLDREQQDEHFLEVIVSDMGPSPRHTPVWVIVRILDENDNEPHFPEKLYQLWVPEHDRSSRGEPLCRVLASDRDLGLNADLSYSIVDGNQDANFAIDPKTATVMSRKTMAAGSSALLTIRATDNGDPPMSSTTQLYMKWISKPVPSLLPLLFTDLYYNFTIPESTQVFEVVGVVSTQQSATPLWFDISGGGYSSHCDICKGVGTVIVAKPLDAELRSSYEVTVTVTDGTHTASTQLYITVLDINDNTPTFSQASYVVTVSEDTPSDTEVLQVRASDADGRSKLSYSIHSSLDPGSAYTFRIAPETGTLYTADRLDQEAQSQHILTVMVREDQEFPYRRDLARIRVAVEDANDHAPYFTQTVYEGSVFETAIAGTYVLQVTALDRDQGKNGELLYSLEAGNSGNMFRIDPVTGELCVIKELDLNSLGQYVITVRATDKGSPPMGAVATVRITVALSDSSIPRFLHTEYHAEISENMPAGSFVMAVSAMSRSAPSYRINREGEPGSFRINQFTGVITTLKPLDYESVTSYELIVEAYNMAGMASITSVIIQVVDANDNSPVFQHLKYRGSISEAAPINSVVLSVDDGMPLVLAATDADKNLNSLLIFQIVDNVAQTFFTVDSGTGSIRSISNLDHETHSEFNFSIIVRDSGQPQLTAQNLAEVRVWVHNINDSPPKFCQDTYETVLLLPTCVAAEVLQVSAVDPDTCDSAGLSFALTDRSLEHFAVDPESGILMVRSSNFSKDRYRFSVEVTDGKFYSTALVTVVVREAMDGGLVFLRPQYSYTVVENSNNVTTVAIVNVMGSRLNEPIRYRLLNAGTQFKVRPTSGVIQTTGLQFDREGQEIYELVLVATREKNHLQVATTTVRIQVEDVNDNPPVFIGLPYYAAVRVDAEPGSHIIQINATDQDKGVNSQVSYYLKDEYQYFEVNPLTGEISLKNPLHVNLSNVEYQVVVFAKDGGVPAHVTAVEFSITVVNKAMPVFEKPFYQISVSEDTAMHTPILSINAASPACDKIIYTIVDGDASSQFSIGYDTGFISIVYPLDYEANSYYRLTVKATDTVSGVGAEVDIDIAVLDENDNPPEFERSSYEAILSETSMIGTTALQVVAVDKDSEKNNVVQYQITPEMYSSTDYFHIDSISGLLFTAHLLDYELMQQHNIIVKVTDNGFPPLSNEVLVTVSVKDANDNPPMFSQTLYMAHVSELAPRGHLVTCVQASDADRSDTSQLRYSILTGNEKNHFAMDEEKGMICLSSQRMQRMQRLYILNVSVSDGIFTSMAQVYISVLEANLYSPVFSQRFYLTQIRENAAGGTRVIQLKATDEDSGRFGQMTYCFVNDLAKDQFIVDATGQILTARKLDRENPVNKDIVLRVMVLDGGGRASFCSVRVMLIDENDNPPHFKATEYRASVKYNVATGFPVIQIQAVDPDEGMNGKVTYSLYSETRVSVVNILEIDTDSGWIITKGSFSHLQGVVLSFFAKAADGGVPVKHSLVSVYIHVLPPEVPIPSFTQPQYSYTVREDTLMGMVLGSVHLNPSRNVVFGLISGETIDTNRGGTLMVERDTGVIRLVKPLDHEAVEAFHFKVSATIKLPQLESVSTVDVEVKVLDLNDNAPSFETGSYEAVVMEGMPIGTRIIQVRALDPDWGSNGQVTYSLVNPRDPEVDRSMNMFSIDSKTGWITSLSDLDYELCPSYTFTVVATDLGETISLSSTALVTVAVVDVNDNPPCFKMDHYKAAVMETGTLGEVVAVLGTQDRDSSDKVSLHITGGNPGGAFALELVQDQWKMYLNQLLDREEQEQYFINVTASDGLFMSQAAVEITVMDSNDNSPVCDQTIYSASISEDVPLNTVLLTVGATDADLGENSEIQYSLFGIGVEDFYMDANTGRCITICSVLLIPRYMFVAQATDGRGRFCRAKVLLTILDVNDNAPTFPNARYTTSVYESATPKALLTRLQALDPDEGQKPALCLDSCTSTPLCSSIYASFFSVTLRNSAPSLFLMLLLIVSGLLFEVPIGENVESSSRKVIYSLQNSAGGVFSVDESTGIVVLEKVLDRELRSSYTVTVQASDGVLHSTADLDILVLDVNDNPPVFQGSNYSASVPEDVTLGTEVLRVYATSADAGTNAEICYSIRSGNELQKFQIAGAALDYEVSRYSLTVQALDKGSPALSSAVTVSIDISDINDNPPLILPVNASIVVQTDEPLGSNVLQLSVTDNDTVLHGPPYEFNIISGNEGEAFVLDQEGLLRTNRTNTIPAVFYHFLYFPKVRDSGRPRLSSSTFVFVRIVEDNLHRPEAFPLEVYIITAGGEFPGGVVGQIHAMDYDGDAALSFSHWSRQRTLFRINRQDGRIVALTGLRPGRYRLNATVSDGRYAVAVKVSVLVEEAADQALWEAIVVRFEGVAPENFVQLYLSSFRNALISLVGTPCRVLGIQPVPGSHGQLDVLLAAEAKGGGFLPASELARMITVSRKQLEGALRISTILEQGCPEVQCGEQWCESGLMLDPGVTVTYSMPKASFVSPHFTLGGTCHTHPKYCQVQLCPADMQCINTQSPGASHACVSTLSFMGNSYIEYRMHEKLIASGFKLDLIIRTFQSQGIIMYMNSDPCTLLKVNRSELWFQGDCKNHQEGLSVPGWPVNDGRWHTVSLEISGDVTTLTLDSRYVERSSRGLSSRPWAPGGSASLVFGARLISPDWKRGSGTQVLDGLQGCLDSVVLNGHEMPLLNEQGHHVEVTAFAQVRPGCLLTSDPCQAEPCQNGGSCSNLPSGGESCCPSPYTGGHCEVEITVCNPSSCHNGASCQPAGEKLRCHCQGGECLRSIPEVCSKLFQAENISTRGRGFFPDRCEGGACAVEVCVNGAVCHCGCTPGLGGGCGTPGAPSSPGLDTQVEQFPYLGHDELIGMAAMLCFTFIFVALLVTFRRRRISACPPSCPPRDEPPPPPPTILHPAPALLHDSDWMQADNLYFGTMQPFDACTLCLELKDPSQVGVQPLPHSGPWLHNVSPGIPNESVSMWADTSLPFTDPRGLAVCRVTPLSLGQSNSSALLGGMLNGGDGMEQDVYQEWTGPRDRDMGKDRGTEKGIELEEEHVRVTARLKQRVGSYLL
uniref:FAT atypical cadherin 3 n=1 Tax=Paramormyrops kingsleyae TaxID=1676925 RepID=A0A3B3RFX2_9TELE